LGHDGWVTTHSLDERLDADRLDQLWDFADPGGSAERFRAELAAGPTPSASAELVSQLARALGLQGRFDEADGMLDDVQPDGLLPVVAVRVALERGRVRNSSGRPVDAVPFFTEALDRARAAGEDFLAVDAAHMLAIADEANAQEWTRLALGLIDASDDPRTARWSGALHNNLGWALHDGGNPAGALDEFSAAEVAYEATGTPEQRRVARWAVARCLRTLGRTDEALEIQQRLHESGPEDGYVSEELGELYLASGDPARAAPYFATAAELLGADEWMVANEPDRMARLRELGAR
jgi:tetratricopeptide (TPR) repeat protein